MTPAERESTIREICDGFYEHERQRVLTAGSARTRRPFYVHFPDPEICSDAEAREILDAVRAEFPDWKITGTRKPADVFAKQARIAASKRRLAHEQRLKAQGE